MDYFIDYDYKKEYPCSLTRKSIYCTRLMYLIINRTDAEVVQNYLLGNPDEINVRNEEGDTALMLASIFGNAHHNTQIVKILLENGANVNLKRNEYGWTALLMAVRNAGSYSNTETVRLLLEHRADLDMRDKDDWTALHFGARYAASESSVETIRLLLEKGADINAKDNKGWTALMIAARYARSTSNLETVRLLLEKGADVNSADTEGYTSLVLAAINVDRGSSLETVHLLLENRADVNTRFNDMTALMYVIKYLGSNNEKEVIHLLLKYGADPNMINQDLFSIIWKNTHRMEIISLFLHYGFDPGNMMIENKPFWDHVHVIWNEYDRYHRISKYPKKSDLSVILKELPIKSQELLFRPNSLRFQIIDCHWNLNKYDEMKQKYSILMIDLCIDDEEIFKMKIRDLFKYII